MFVVTHMHIIYTEPTTQSQCQRGFANSRGTEAEHGANGTLAGEHP